MVLFQFSRGNTEQSAINLPLFHTHICTWWNSSPCLLNSSDSSSPTAMKHGNETGKHFLIRSKFFWGLQPSTSSLLNRYCIINRLDSLSCDCHMTYSVKLSGLLTWHLWMGLRSYIPLRRTAPESGCVSIPYLHQFVYSIHADKCPPAEWPPTNNLQTTELHKN